MKKKLLYFIVALIAFAPPAYAQDEEHITSLDNLKAGRDMVFESAHGAYYVWQYSGGHCTQGQAGVKDNNSACNGAAFDGKQRKKAKTSFASGQEVDVNDYPAFLRTLPADGDICGTITDDMDRTADEQHNIKVKFWLYAFKRENDEDYHLLVGISPDYETANEHGFYNIEIGGTPAHNAASFSQIKKARDDFEHFFSITDCAPVCRNYVDFYLNPIRIEVTGSMFYDEGHCHSLPKIKDYPLITAWEIHPVRSIRFIE